MINTEDCHSVYLAFSWKWGAKLDKQRIWDLASQRVSHSVNQQILISKYTMRETPS